MGRHRIFVVTLAALLTSGSGLAQSQDQSIVGVWQYHEGSGENVNPNYHGPTDGQWETLVLTADGQAKLEVSLTLHYGNPPN
jgi:hypothetical protein